MNEIFEFFKTPAGQGLLSAGLGVAANAGRGGTWNAIGRGGLMGLAGYANAQNQQAETAERTKLGEYRDWQIANAKAEAERRNAALAKEAQRQSALPSLFQQNGSGPAGFDVMGAVRAGFGPDEIQKYAGLADVGRPKATRQIEIDDGQGGKRIALVDDFGREVGAFNGYVAPVQINQGDRVTFAKPAAGVSLPVNMSQSERDAAARGWANVGISKAQLEQGKTQVVNDPNQGPMLINKVTGIASPITSPNGQAIPGEAAVKQAMGARRALNILDEADKLIGSATGSYAGAGVDEAARAFGVSTKGAQATAKLKALEGSLMMAQPRMEGPQSNMDVALYRQMAGQIGDPTVPANTKKAAVATIRELHEKYAAPTPPAAAPRSGGASGGWSIQKVN